MDTPAIPPPPAVPSSAVIQVTKHQAWSAAVQNVVACVCVTVLCWLGKISAEFALVAIGLVVGVDFAGRKALHKGGAAALAFGSTGVLSLLSKLPHIGAVVLALLTALGIAGCSGDPLPEFGQKLLLAQKGYERALDAYDHACRPKPIQGAEAVCDEAYKLLSEVASGLETVTDAYSDINDLAKAAQ